VTVVLRIQRSSGSTEVVELPAVGDYVFVPRGLLSSEDVLGFDVEVTGLDRCDVMERAGSDAWESGGTKVLG
jgi:hypothetical protein